MSTAHLLQICPHDSPPFGALCRFYEQAAQSLGMRMQTVYLAPPNQVPQTGADYLSLPLHDSRALQTGLNDYAVQDWQLILCHRYRAYWTAATSMLDSTRCIAVAHEYGMFRRWQRRMARRWQGRWVRFAGIAPEICDELAAVVGDAHLLPNGVDVDSTLTRQIPRSQARQRLGIDEALGPVVGVVGRLHYKKRPQLALDSVLHLRRQGVAAQLVFVGDGELRESLQQSGHDDLPVTFCGNVPDAGLLFGAFDALLHTADGEAFGMVALEALLAGVPVATRQVQGPAYVLGELGCYATQDTPSGYAAALKQALTQTPAGLRDAGIERARAHFSVGAAARRLDNLLFEIHQRQ